MKRNMINFSQPRQCISEVPYDNNISPFAGELKNIRMNIKNQYKLIAYSSWSIIKCELSFFNFPSYILYFAFLIFLLTGCYKAENFHAELTKIPQIDFSNNNRYPASYLVGDTMAITGKLNSNDDLNITVGGVKANITWVQRLHDIKVLPNGKIDTSYLERAFIAITEEMLGEKQPVIVKSNGIEITGTSIDVLPRVDPNGFDKPLQLKIIKPMEQGSVIFTHVNGKGDIYYLSALDTAVKHVDKNGNVQTLLTARDTFDLENGDRFVLPPPSLSSMCGTVTPDGKTLYFFVSGTYYGRDMKYLLQIHLETKKAKLLSTKVGSSYPEAPFEGKITEVNFISILQMQADDKGNLFLDLATVDDYNTQRMAVAVYNGSTGMVSYLVRIDMDWFNFLPGVPLKYSDVRFGLEDGILYFTDNDESLGAVIRAFNISTKTSIKIFDPVVPAGNTYLGRFSNINSDFAQISENNTDAVFGLLPRKGFKLQLLYGQADWFTTSGSLPQWLTIDFEKEMVTALAPGKFDRKGHFFQPLRYTNPSIDIPNKLLNYDEEGHLYFSVGARNDLGKTEVAR